MKNNEVKMKKQIQNYLPVALKLLFIISTMFIFFIFLSCSDDESKISDISQNIDVVESNQLFQIIARIANIGFIISIIVIAVRWVLKTFSSAGWFVPLIFLNYLSIVGLLYFFEYCGWILFINDLSIWIVGLVIHVVCSAYGFMMYFLGPLIIIAFITDLIICILLFLYAHYFVQQVIILNFFVPLIIFYVFNEIKGFVEGFFAG